MSTKENKAEASGIADKTEGVALSAAFGVDAKAFMDAWGTVFKQATQQPRALFEANVTLVRAITQIWLGTSDIEPDAGDARFRDAAWTESPVFKRIGQSYVAWTRALDGWLEASGLDGIDRERARFVLDAAKDLLAPMNTLIGNPEAIAKLSETRGGSIASGIKNFFDDLQHNHGYPAVADRSAFEIGKDVAATDGSVVFRNDVFELIQYAPTTKHVSAVPLLYVFSQVNRFYLGDLTPDRSLFRRLLDGGVQVYAISWRNPEREHGHWNLDTYTGATIEAFDIVRQISGQAQIDVIGLCAGGLVTAAAAGVLAARGDDWINSLSLFVNVLDNRPGDSDFGLFVSERSVNAQKLLVRRKGMFNEKDVFEMFAMLRIEDSVMSFFRSNYLLGEAPPKHPLLFWSMDYTRVPAEMQCDFLDLSYNNDLPKRELRVMGKRIDLTKIQYPVYIMAGSTDHITPWKACYRSAQLFGGDVEFVLTNQNHTQTISARTDNKHLRYWIGGELPDDADAWKDNVTEYPGSWTGHWVQWLGSVSDAGKVVAPDVLGGENFPVLDAAPGKYVKM